MRSIRWFLKVVVLACTPALADPIELRPVSVGQFYVSPDQPASVAWSIAGDAPETLSYTIADYWDNPVSQGQATLGDGKAVVSVSLAQGYYEISFDGVSQRFGIISMPAHGTAADPFFGMDAGLSWLEQSADIREQLIAVMKRSGVSIVRERVSWSHINPAKGTLELDAQKQYDALRATYRAHDLPVLEILYGRAEHLQGARPTAFPQKLGYAAEVWSQVAGQWGAGWNGMEVWNEPDLVSLPADQYVPAVKMAAYANEQAKVRAPIIAGAFGAASPGDYHRQCAANGMLDFVDGVSFHTYRPAAELASSVAKYRDWLAESDRRSMPIWLTEAGRPWTIGTPRARVDEDMQCALEMVSLASESRAVGIARFFPFILSFYEEGGLKSFSMLGKERSPMRSMAGYVNAIRVLSGSTYVGDIDHPSDVQSARVFARGDDRVAVVLTSDVSAAATTKLPFAIIRAVGIDGRALAVGADGAIAVPDGLCYVWVGKAQVDAALKTDAPAMALLKQSQQPIQERGRAQSLVLQHALDGETARVSPRYYLVRQQNAARLPIRVRVQNLAAEPQRVELRLTLPGDSNEAIAPVTLDVPALGEADATWTVDATKALDYAEARYVTVTARTHAGVTISPLAIPYMIEGTLQQHLSRHRYQERLPITDLGRWTNNIVSHGTMQVSAVGEVWRFDASYTRPGERWAYPRFRLTQPLDAARAKGVLVRARVVKPGGSNVAMMLLVNDHPGFWSNEIFPADGEWHVAYVPFAGCQPQPGNPEMQNSVMDVSRFSAINLGFRSNDESNAMEVSDLIILGD